MTYTFIEDSFEKRAILKTDHKFRKDQKSKVFRYKAVIGSTTQAMNAQKTLAKAAIRSDVVKISSGHSNNGCIYGIEFAPEQYRNVQYILSSYGIKVREYITE